MNTIDSLNRMATLYSSKIRELKQCNTIEEVNNTSFTMTEEMELEDLRYRLTMHDEDFYKMLGEATEWLFEEQGYIDIGVHDTIYDSIISRYLSR